MQQCSPYHDYPPEHRSPSLNGYLLVKFPRGKLITCNTNSRKRSKVKFITFLSGDQCAHAFFVMQYKRKERATYVSEELAEDPQTCHDLEHLREATSQVKFPGRHRSSMKMSACSKSSTGRVMYKPESSSEAVSFNHENSRTKGFCFDFQKGHCFRKKCKFAHELVTVRRAFPSNQDHAEDDQNLTSVDQPEVSPLSHSQPAAVVSPTFSPNSLDCTFCLLGLCNLRNEHCSASSLVVPSLVQVWSSIFPIVLKKLTLVPEDP